MANPALGNRAPFVCGNWKLHHDVKATRALVDALKTAVPAGVDVAVAPVMTTLHAACENAKGSKLAVAAQNVHFADKGAFTGEVSVAHLKELGVSHVIIGHSERRQYFAETDETVAKKLRAVLDAGLVPIACVGETLAEREGQKTRSVIERQVRALTDALSGQEIARVVVAYEPVWAIGTGKNATAEQAQDVHKLIRGLFADAFASEAEKMRILYGGSVKPDNAAQILAEKDVDGALVGGASLEAKSFQAIVDAAKARV